MAKPDDRSDNVEKIQHAISNTVENFREAEDFVQAHRDEMSAKDLADIDAKNHRRQEAIEGFRSKMKDAARSQRT